jgi:hypothetical protein
MKKLLMLALPLVVLTGISSAATVTSCTSQTTWSLATLISNGGCQIGDKVFTNFSDSLSNAANTIAFTGPAGPVGPGLAFYQINVNAGVNSVLQGGFTFGYTVTIDQSQVVAGYNSALTRLTGGIQDNGTDGATLTKSVTGGATCSAGATDSFGTVSPSPCNMNATSINVSETFAYTANNSNPGGAHSISGIGNTFTESFSSTTGVPEPMSMLLLGTGLSALAMIGRKRVKR